MDILTEEQTKRGITHFTSEKWKQGDATLLSSDKESSLPRAMRLKMGYFDDAQTGKPFFLETNSETGNVTLSEYDSKGRVNRIESFQGPVTLTSILGRPASAESRRARLERLRAEARAYSELNLRPGEDPTETTRSALDAIFTNPSSLARSIMEEFYPATMEESGESPEESDEFDGR